MVPFKINLNPRFRFIPLFLLAIGYVLCPEHLFAQTPKYNVLFIAIDDMNDRCSFLGNPEVLTPNLQRLVSRGMVFKTAYCQFPLCSPSRTSLLSGWRPDKTGIFDNTVRPRSIMGPDVVFLPEYFKQYGYRTERYGKIMHGPYESDITWDFAEPKERKRITNFSNNNFTNDDEDKVFKWWIDDVPDSILHDGDLARDLVKRLQQPQTQPFFYAFGPSVHNPFTPSLQYWNDYGDPSVQERLPIDSNGTKTKLKGNGSEPIVLPQTIPGDRNDVPAVAFPVQQIMPDSEWKRMIHAYDGEVTQKDAQLGLILDEMDRQNLWENTVVVFWSDHGQHLGEHEGLWGKQTLFEESLHIPLIVCVPGKRAGVCNALIELVDLYPTLAEICGLPAPKGMEGSSFAALLDNPNLPWKRAVFSQVKREGGREVETDRYRYNNWGADGEELYDHATDPKEYTNLATNPQYTTVLSQMRAILADGWTKSLPPCQQKATITPDGSLDICSTGSVILEVNGGPGYTYQWMRNDKIIQNATRKRYTARRTGTFKVTVTNGSKCSTVSNSVTVTNSCKSFNAEPGVSQQINFESLLLLYPNPSHSEITAKYNCLNENQIQLKVFDITGKTVFTKTDMAIKGINTYHLNLSKLAPATYYLELRNNNEIKRVKFVIEK